MLVLDSFQTTFQEKLNSLMVQLSGSSSNLETKAHTLFQMDRSNLLAGMEFILVNSSLPAYFLSSTGMLLCLASKILLVVISH